MFENNTEESVINPYFEKMISRWKRISKEIKQDILCRTDRKLLHKKRRKETLNNGKVI